MEFSEYLSVIDKFEKEVKKELNSIDLGNYRDRVLKAIEHILFEMEKEVAEMDYPRGV